MEVLNIVNAWVSQGRSPFSVRSLVWASATICPGRLREEAVMEWYLTAVGIEAWVSVYRHRLVTKWARPAVKRCIAIHFESVAKPVDYSFDITIKKHQPKITRDLLLLTLELVKMPYALSRFA